MIPSGMGERYFFDNAHILPSEIKTKYFPGFVSEKGASRDKGQVKNSLDFISLRGGRFFPFLTVVVRILGSKLIFMYNYFL